MKLKNLMIAALLLLSGFALIPDRKIEGVVRDQDNVPLRGVLVGATGGQPKTTTNANGHFVIQVPVTAKTLVFFCTGFKQEMVKITADSVMKVKLTLESKEKQETIAYEMALPNQKMSSMPSSVRGAASTMGRLDGRTQQIHNTENYNPIGENSFQITRQHSVTTFSVDVDRAAYSNVRRFLNMGQMPPVDAVRIEELVNYFDYRYPQPKGEHPIAVTTELTDSPWNKGLKLLHIGLQAKSVATGDLPASNLVFLIDVSGSMMDNNKLPLLKQAFKLLVDQLREQDKVSIIVYAGAAGMVLPPTPGNEKMTIKEAIDNLQAGGSTAGGAGIELAYKVARENFIARGNNRVMLATDGDFNVGVSSEGELQRLIEEKRKDGVYLSIAGFGMGNYKDSHIETLADKGNGNYAYIDNIQEARKVFVQEFGGTLFTVAKDVKLQIEFNPGQVKAYRLIGYENRALENEAFHDDKKDAGDMGSGHTVTAIYEIVPAGVESDYLAKLDDLKYQKTTASEIGKTDELLTLKIRYKNPDRQTSKLFETTVTSASKPMATTSENFRFAASVAEYGLLLRKSEFKGKASYDEVIIRAKAAFGKDEEGYRSEFVQLVKTTRSLDNRKETASKD